MDVGFLSVLQFIKFFCQFRLFLLIDLLIDILVDLLIEKFLNAVNFLWFRKDLIINVGVFILNYIDFFIDFWGFSCSGIILINCRIYVIICISNILIWDCKLLCLSIWITYIIFAGNPLCNIHILPVLGISVYFVELIIYY